MERKYTPKEVPLKTIEDILDRYQEEKAMGSTALHGLYYALDMVYTGHWIACANAGGHCIVDEFSSKEEAVAYLKGLELNDGFEWIANAYRMLPDDEWIAFVMEIIRNNK